MKINSLRFPNSAGLMLSARLDTPADGAYHTMALFAHCFTCSKNVNSVAHVSRFLTQEGFAVFRFDFTGLGDSQGDFGDTNFATNVDDLCCAAKFLAQNYQAPKLLIGHSLGGTAVIQAALRISAAKALVTIGSPADPKHVLTHIDTAVPDIQSKGEAIVDLADRSFRIKKQYIDNLEQTDIKPALKTINKAILILHSPLDDTVGIEHAGVLFQAARHPKSFISLDRADHLLSKKSDAKYVAGVIAVWVRHYL
jgi:alpha/beta superfamily hydrolase